MSFFEEDKFYLNRSPCVLSIEEDSLVIKFLAAYEEATKISHGTKVIPFNEILTTRLVDSESGPEKPKPGFSLKRKSKLPHVLVRTVKRCKDSRWKTVSIKLKSSSQDLCLEWENIIREKLTKSCSFRPRSLLVFINPHGGSGVGQNIYNKKVEPVFREAGIKTKVITTTFRHHAKTYIETRDSSMYDGVIAVGGDGMLNEIINGLICRTQSKNGISVDTKKGNPRICPKFIRPNMKVGIIPAGSTDCVSYVTQGINDPETSALHIALGDSHPVDVVSLHNSDGVLQQFSMSLTGYGYMGDMLRHSETYRWMGPSRYTFVGTNVFFRNKSYSGEVHYVPANGKDDPKTPSFCRTPCTVCQDGLLNEEASRLFTPQTPSSNFEEESKGLMLKIDVKKSEIIDEATQNKGAGDAGSLPDKEGLVDSGIQEDIADVTEMPVVHVMEEKDDQTNPTDMDECFNMEQEKNKDLEMTESKDGSGDQLSEKCFSERPRSLPLSQQDEVESEKEEWKVISGDFMSVNGVTMSCACERSPLGLSPYCHLCDGALDLIIVRSCTRLEFLRFMLAHTGRGDRFDFPFVEVHRVKAFQFVPSVPPPLPALENQLPTPGSPSDGSGCESVHISLQDFSVKYQTGKKKKRREPVLKRSQSVLSNPVSTWNSDGEIVEEPNMTVRVHRGLILLFCRGIEEMDQ